MTHILALFLVIAINAACSDNVPVVVDRCVLSEITFDYEPFASNHKSAISENSFLPSQPWQLETKLTVSNLWLLAVRKAPDAASEIWLSNSKNEVLIYQTNTKIVKKINLAASELEQPPFYRFFLRKDNSIWAYNYYSSLNLGHSAQPIVLSQYNDQAGAFEYEEATKEIPNGITNSQLSYPNIILLDENGVFWILVPNDFIYSYDPASRNLTRHVALSSFIPIDASITSNGTIYFVENLKENSEYHDNLFRYMPNAKAIELVNVNLEPWPNINQVWIDHSDNLWANATGWMEPNGNWHQLLRSPIFISNKVENGNYLWQNPRIIFESSNNLLWFRSLNGMAWLNPKKEQWCWFTSYQSNIVEDADHNLWMIADNNLYKFPLKP